MTYKILNGYLILEPNMMPKMSFQRPVRECTQAKVGASNQLIEPQSRLDVVKTTFFYATPKIWNDSVTPVQANAPSTDAFKNHFKK